MRLKTQLCALLAGLALALTTGRVAAQDPQWGGADDVPTWQVGDSWDMQRNFTLDINGNFEVSDDPRIVLYVELGIDFQDLYTLELTPTTQTAVVNNGLPGFNDTLAYVRERTAGSMTIGITGARLSINSGFTNATTVTVQAAMNAVDSSLNGLNWTSVGDLSQIREQFSFPRTQGSIRIDPIATGTNLLCLALPGLTNEEDPANGVHCGQTYPFFLEVILTLDHVGVGPAHGSGLELQDFAQTTVGEQWQGNGLRGIRGFLRIQALEDAGEPGTYLLDEQFDIPDDTAIALAYRLGLVGKGVSDPNVAGITDARQLVGTGGNGDTIYYSPSQKEISSWLVANLPIPIDAGDENTVTVDLNGFMTRLASSTAATLNPVGDIGGAEPPVILLTPALPEPGQQFTLTGNVDASVPDGTAVSATILVPGSPGTVVSGVTALQAFSLTLTAPTFGDQSPTVVGPLLDPNRELGSFGIDINLGDATPPRNHRTVTVRIKAPNASGSWLDYE